MKALTKPEEFRTGSSLIYGYEDNGRPQLFHEDSNGAFYFDCVADPEYPVCNTDCWWIVLDGEVVYDSCE